jgi:hypothetical protein
MTSVAAAVAALLIASTAEITPGAGPIATPAAGDACAAAVPALASQAGVPISSVWVDIEESTKPPWVYQAPVKGGKLMVDFDKCAPKPAWLVIRYMWLNRAVPIKLTLTSGPIRSIAAHLEGSAAVIVAQDRQARTVRTVFKEKSIEIHVGNERTGLIAGFGVPYSDYCADIVESKTGPTVKWCGD